MALEFVKLWMARHDDEIGMEGKGDEIPATEFRASFKDWWRKRNPDTTKMAAFSCGSLGEVDALSKRKKNGKWYYRRPPIKCAPPALTPVGPGLYSPFPPRTFSCPGFVSHTAHGGIMPPTPTAVAWVPVPLYSTPPQFPPPQPFPGVGFPVSHSMGFLGTPIYGSCDSLGSVATSPAPVSPSSMQPPSTIPPPSYPTQPWAQVSTPPFTAISPSFVMATGPFLVPIPAAAPTTTPSGSAPPTNPFAPLPTSGHSPLATTCPAGHPAPPPAHKVDGPVPPAPCPLPGAENPMLGALFGGMGLPPADPLPPTSPPDPFRDPFAPGDGLGPPAGSPRWGVSGGPAPGMGMGMPEDFLEQPGAQFGSAATRIQDDDNDNDEEDDDEDEDPLRLTVTAEAPHEPGRT
ncbi:hypothetical protein PAPYR_379 [Paratrimastix pyriformis]|uniref:Uncharacterized protein n=1 Tax=Paratrimastix pyriformis TaxID=342808 RepID=A0ABQ8V225_9EUKA|nr:hypothetical protein PAPYR_379 [Paratrimastix pyriformis]